MNAVRLCSNHGGETVAKKPTTVFRLSSSVEGGAVFALLGSLIYPFCVSVACYLVVGKVNEQRFGEGDKALKNIVECDIHVQRHSTYFSLTMHLLGSTITKSIHPPT